MFPDERGWGCLWHCGVVLLLLPLAAGAEIYKCVKDGTVAYQQHRCDAGSTGVPSRDTLANSMAGCYLPLAADPGWYEVRRVQETLPEPEYFRDDDYWLANEYRRYYWRRDAKGRVGLWLFRSNRPAGAGMQLRAASMAEVRSASGAAGLDLRQGVTYHSAPKVHSDAYVVPGIYRGRDAAGAEVYYLHFPPEKGRTSKVVCR